MFQAKTPPRLQVFKRAKLSGDVIIHNEECLFHAALGNLSAGGLYMTSCPDLRLGESVRVVIKAKGLTSPVQAIGRVVRVEHGCGLAVEFISISSESRAVIQNCVQENRLRRALNAG